MPLDIFYVLWVATQNTDYWKLKLSVILNTTRQHLLIFCLIDINSLIPTAGSKILSGEISTIRPLDSFDLILMVLELLNALKIYRIIFLFYHSPDACCSVKTAAREEVSLGSPRDTPNGFGVAILECANTFPHHDLLAILKILALCPNFYGFIWWWAC